MANVRTARRSGLVLRGGKDRRNTLWGDVTPVFNTMTAGGGTITNVQSAAVDALTPFTIVRSRMAFYLRSDQSAAAEDQVCAFGIAVVSAQAAAIGVTAVPTPVTDLGSDAWLLHKIMFNSVGAGAVDNIRGHYMEEDSKAMRKVEDGFELTFVAEIDAAIGNGAVLFSGGRVLLKLH